MVLCGAHWRPDTTELRLHVWWAWRIAARWMSLSLRCIRLVTSPVVAVNAVLEGITVRCLCDWSRVRRAGAGIRCYRLSRIWPSRSLLSDNRGWLRLLLACPVLFRLWIEHRHDIYASWRLFRRCRCRVLGRRSWYRPGLLVERF